MRPLFLVLLDLESTVLNVPDEDVCRCRALEQAIFEISGMRPAIQPSADETDYSKIVRAFRSLGLDGDEFLGYQLFKQIEEKTLLHYSPACPENLEPNVRAGLTSLIISCRGRAYAPLFAPLSTALEGIVRLWLERSQLSRVLDLSSGGYSSWRRYQPDLIKMARERAGGALMWPAAQTIVVSANPALIAAARGEGVRAVFVGDAEGLNTPEAAVIADCVIERLDELHGLLIAWA